MGQKPSSTASYVWPTNCFRECTSQQKTSILMLSPASAFNICNVYCFVFVSEYNDLQVNHLRTAGSCFLIHFLNLFMSSRTMACMILQSSEQWSYIAFQHIFNLKEECHSIPFTSLQEYHYLHRLYTILTSTELAAGFPLKGLAFCDPQIRYEQLSNYHLTFPFCQFI